MIREIDAGRLLPVWAKPFLGLAAFGSVLGVLGPFGSYLDSTMSLRLMYWIGTLAAGSIPYGAGLVASYRFTREGSGLRWLAFGLTVALASIPQTFVARSAAFLLWPMLRHGAAGWGIWYCQVLSIGALTIGGYVISRGLRPPPAHRGEARGLANRHAALGRDVIALQMEDHYVRIHTQTGSTLALMPLHQAIAQLVPVAGLQTHRSWWVARHAVAQVEGSSRSMRLRLVNGLTAPVARSSIAQLRAAGWLDRGDPLSSPPLTPS